MARTAHLRQGGTSPGTGPGTCCEGNDVNKGMLAVLNESERLLVLETDKAELAKLDEDGLIALHDRIRRARNKYTGQYRRGGAAKVGAKGGRGKASQQNQTARAKAEAFEDALARVSAALAAAARRSAAELKAERLEAARSTSAAPAAKAPARSGRAASKATTTTKRTRSDASAVSKKNASTLAAGARRQAKRDSR